MRVRHRRARLPEYKVDNLEKQISGTSKTRWSIYLWANLKQSLLCLITSCHLDPRTMDIMDKSPNYAES